MINETQTHSINTGSMVRDIVGSISLIVIGNSLKVKIDSIVDSIYTGGGDPELWAFVLKASSVISMWTGIAVGCMALYRFIMERIELYREKKAKNRNQDS